MALVSHVAWSERRLLVYNLHLESRGNDRLRSSQLAEVASDIHQCGSDLPVVVGGDFNFELSRDPGISVVNGATLRNPFNHGDHLQPQRGLDWVLHGRLIGSWLAARYVMTGPNCTTTSLLPIIIRCRSHCISADHRHTYVFTATVAVAIRR